MTIVVEGYYIKVNAQKMIIDDTILTRYVMDEATEKERRQVAVWAHQSTENFDKLEKLYAVLRLVKEKELVDQIDTAYHFAEFKKRIRKEASVYFFRQLSVWSVRAAAILFIPLLIYTYSLQTMPPKKVQAITITTKPSMIASFYLPDSTQVWLDAGATLTYPVQFDAKHRQVAMTGQAYFEVTKDAKRPFTVNASDQLSIEVLGTKFNIKAYPTENNIQTTLKEGLVRLSMFKGKKNENSVLLYPNQKATYSKKTHNVSIVKEEAYKNIAWKDGKLIFDRTPMNEVLKEITRRYNVQFKIKDATVLESVITGRFEVENVSQIMDYLHLASGLKYKILKTKIKQDATLNETIIELQK